MQPHKVPYSLPGATEKEVQVTMIQRFFQEEEGQTLVEYGLLISLIALVVIAILSVLGNKISNTFNKAANSLAA